MIPRFFAELRRTASAVLILPVRVYQVAIGPLLPKVCRFEPSCSEYFIQAVRRHGPFWGAWKGMGRVCRCQPWGNSGFDPP